MGVDFGGTPVRRVYFEGALVAAFDAVTGAPGVPTSVSASHTGYTATLNWQPPTSDGGSPITGYRVGRNGSDSTGFGAYSTVLDATARTVTFDKLLAQTYTLSVSAITANGESTTVTRDVTIEATAPTPVAGSLGVLSGLPWGSGAFTMFSASNRQAFEAARGRQIDVAVAYTTRDTWATNYQTWWKDHLAGFTGKVNLAIPLIPLNEGSIASAAAGAYHSNYVTWAQGIAATGLDVMIRPGWEMNLHAGYRYSCLVGQEANWREAFRQLVTSMRSVIPDLEVDWCPNAGGSASGTVVNPYPDAYPGDEYVTYIGVDSYNWYPVVTSAAEWPAHRDKTKGLTYYLNLAKSRGKKFSLAEWGTYPEVFPASDDADYIQAMYDWFVANAGDIGFEAYFNETASYYRGAVEPASSPNAAVRYKALWQPTAASVPSAPTITLTQAAGDVSVSWSAPANGGSALTGYTLQRRTGTGAWSTINSPAAGATSYLDTTPAAGTLYGYRLAAKNTVGTGPYSAEKTITTAGTSGDGVTGFDNRVIVRGGGYVTGVSVG